MEFEKIDIDDKTFDKIYKAVWNAYRYGNTKSCQEDMKVALESVVFNVKKPFVEGEWNCCTITPPECYSLDDVIIRRKGLSAYDSGHTSSIKDYTLAYFRLGTNEFVDENGDNVFEHIDQSKFEYKFIK